MKKIFLVVLMIAFLLPATVFAERNPKVCPPIVNPNPNFYGNVYVWDEDTPFLWSVINAVHSDGTAWLEMQNKTTALINKGEVMDIRITAPVKYSRIRIYYKKHIYDFRLKPYLLGRNFILFTYAGDG